MKGLPSKVCAITPIGHGKNHHRTLEFMKAFAHFSFARPETTRREACSLGHVHIVVKKNLTLGVTSKMPRHACFFRHFGHRGQVEVYLCVG